MRAGPSDALIVDAVRSPIGRRNGALSKLRGDELAAQVLNALVARQDLDPGEVEDVQLDAASSGSHRRAVAAIDEGRFENEIVPVEVTNPHVGALVGVDETPRRDTSAEALAALKPAFLPDGKVTAGNSSQICDGAAAVLLTSEVAASRLGLEPRARFASVGLAGGDPDRM